jgi:multiple sugar transport system permease protein
MAVGPRVLEAAGFPGPGRRSRLREWWEQEHVFGYGLIVPAIVLLVSLVAFPFAMAIYFSLSDYWVGSPGGWVGLQNYRDILENETFRQTVQNSFVFTIVAVALKIVLGVWLAMLLARNLKFKRLIRGVVLLPFVIPTALSTLAWLWMFDSLYSVVNWTAIRLHLIAPRGPTGSASRPTRWPRSSSSTSGAACPSSPSPCSRASWRCPASTTKPPRWMAPAPGAASST